MLAGRSTGRRAARWTDERRGDDQTSRRAPVIRARSRANAVPRARARMLVFSSGTAKSGEHGALMLGTGAALAGRDGGLVSLTGGIGTLSVRRGRCCRGREHGGHGGSVAVFSGEARRRRAGRVSARRANAGRNARERYAGVQLGRTLHEAPARLRRCADRVGPRRRAARAAR